MWFAFLLPGPLEWVIIGVLLLLIFGTRLDRIGRLLGRTFTGFRRDISEDDEE